MIIVEPGYEFITEKDPVKKIELVARTCYKSEAAITEDSGKKMVKNLIKNQHLAMLEHADILVEFNDMDSFSAMMTARNVLEGLFRFRPYLTISVDNLMIGANIRAWYEFFKECAYFEVELPQDIADVFFTEKYELFFGDLKDRIIFEKREVKNRSKEVDPESLKSQNVYGCWLMLGKQTVKFTVDRGVSHEIVRHRPASFAQESTRYCNYNKKGNQVTFVRPPFLDHISGGEEIWTTACRDSEYAYMQMLANGASPQEARDLLIHSVKTEVVMTATYSEWNHFFALRAVGATGKPHPQMQQVAVPLMKEFAERFGHPFSKYFNNLTEEDKKWLPN